MEAQKLMKYFLLTVISFCFLNEVVTAQTVTVYQIELPKVANPQAYNIILGSYGSVEVKEESQGIVKYYLGTFQTEREAQSVEKKINALGIMHTKIKAVDKSGNIASSSAPTTPRPVESKFTVPEKVVTSTNVTVPQTTVEQSQQELPSGSAPGSDRIEVIKPERSTSSNPSSPGYVRETPVEKTEEINSNPITEQTETVVKSDPVPANAVGAPIEVKEEVKEVVNDVPKKPKANRPNRPGIKRPKVGPKKANKKPAVVKNKTPEIEETTSEVEGTFPVYENPNMLPETGAYALLLPKVANPEVYLIVLRDLGHVVSDQLPDSRWYSYFGFFNSKEEANQFIPQIKGRGFSKAMYPIRTDILDTEVKFYLDKEEAINTANAKSTLSNPEIVNEDAVPKAFDVSGTIYRIELPNADNPEIYLSVFKDIGPSKSEVSPNNTGVYYIGAFNDKQTASTKLDEMLDRGLRSGKIVTFLNDVRQEPYESFQVENQKDLNTIIEEKKAAAEYEAAPEIPMMPTDDSGRYQIRLAQVDNPEVYASVFKDVGIIRSGNFDDGVAYFFMGNYLALKDAEYVQKQIYERGLTSVEIVDVTSISNVNPNAKVIDVSYKLLLPGISNPKVYEVVFKPIGEMTTEYQDGAAIYYLGPFNSKEEAYKAQQKVREAGLQTDTKIIEFQDGRPVE